MADVGTLSVSGRCQRIANMTIDRRELRVSPSFNPAVEMKYSNAAAAPASFAACASTSFARYDPAVKYVCFSSEGPLLAGTPIPNCGFQIRTRIK